MSSVFSGWDRTLGREVAIKVLAADLVEDRVFVERFDREARAAASLSHRNVVAVFDSGVDAGARFIVMERVSGRTLASHLRDGPLPIEQAVEIAVSISQALGAAHAGGIVHRDVKPGNVMLADNGQVKVLDFGIARALAATSLTRASTVIGTAGYLSPEQAEGGPVDARSDLYSLGCVLYEMLTGRPPFVADSAAALVNQHLTRPPEPPSRWRLDVSPALDEIVLRCLAKDPGARYPRASALSGALIKAPETRTADTGTGATTTVLPQPQRERRWIAAVAAGALVGALLILFALYHHTAGHSSGAPARASADAQTRAAARGPKRSPAAGSRPAAATSTTGASAGPAAQASTTAGPSAAAAALSALTVADQRQGLIDSRAAEVLSRRTAALLNALASADSNQAARQLSQFGRRVDELAVTGGIANQATAGALKAAAAQAAGALVASSPASGEPDAGGGAPPPADNGKKRGHRLDGPAGEPQD
jgi:serine/threonine-protein kinase